MTNCSYRLYSLHYLNNKHHHLFLWDYAFQKVNHIWNLAVQRQKMCSDTYKNDLIRHFKVGTKKEIEALMPKAAFSRCWGSVSCSMNWQNSWFSPHGNSLWFKDAELPVLWCPPLPSQACIINKWTRLSSSTLELLPLLPVFLTWLSEHFVLG